VSFVNPYVREYIFSRVDAGDLFFKRNTLTGGKQEDTEKSDEEIS